jgi:acetyl esterase
MLASSVPLRTRAAAARRRFEAALARTLARVPEPVIARLLARGARHADDHRLDPQVQWADVLRRLSGRPPIEVGSVARARREYRNIALLERRPPRLPHVEDRTIDGDAGPIPVRVYRPRPGATLPALLYLHGGGGVIGDLETHDGTCRLFAKRSDCVVVAVDYRLAPEHSYAESANDCVAAYRWLLDATGELGIDRERVIVAGDSRGGKLAAVLCQLVRHEGLPQPRAQVLIYPSTDVSTDYPSRTTFADAPWLSAGLMQWFERHALPQGLDRSDPRVSPMLGDLHGLAPAIVVVGGFDPLRDEGLAYARRLEASGVPVVVQLEPTLPHAFIHLTGVSRRAARATDDIADAVRHAFVRWPP